MLKLYHVTVSFIFLWQVDCQSIIGDACTLQSTGSSGTCKLLSVCQQIREQVATSLLLPQTCGFQGTQPIVCCPKKQEARKPGEISRQKCREYSSYANDKSEDSQTTKNECGHSIVKRITNGKLAGRKEFAHMAAIGYESAAGEVKWSCGGSIISEEYVLTTAFCLDAKSKFGLAKYVKIGASNLNDTTQGQILNVAERIMHPNFQLPSWYNDIALLKLEKPIEMNSFARPACLYFKPEISAERAVAAAWGTTESGLPSYNLLKVTLNLIDDVSCKETYGILYDRQLCTATCSRDSGCPLQIYHIGDDVACMYDIVGLISFGPKICYGSTVYTRISYYIKWIEDHVWPKSS